MGAQALPLAILATGFRLQPDDLAEITGVLYFSGKVPPDFPGRRSFTWALLNGECCQVVVHGTSSQIENLLRVAAVSSGWAFDNSLGIDGCIRAAKEASLPFGFDNIEESTGLGLPVAGEFWLTEHDSEIARRLENLRDELELTLAVDWDPATTWLAI